MTDNDNVNTTSSPNTLAEKYSCVTCHKRKVKCDRETPCANCIKHKVTCQCESLSTVNLLAMDSVRSRFIPTALSQCYECELVHEFTCSCAEILGCFYGLILHQFQTFSRLHQNARRERFPKICFVPKLLDMRNNYETWVCLSTREKKHRSAVKLQQFRALILPHGRCLDLSI